MNKASHEFFKRETQIHPEDIKPDPNVCRKKLAQKTFDVTCGGSTYLPTPTVPRGMDVLEAAYGKEYAMSVGRSSVNVRNDEIGRLYRKHDTFLLPDFFPCRNKTNAAYFRFPNNKFYPNYLENVIGEDCILHLTYLLNENTVNEIRIPFDVDIKDCCKDFFKILWCSKDTEAISQLIDNFENCVIKKIMLQYSIVFNYSGPLDFMPIAIINDITNFYNKISDLRIKYIDLFLRDKDQGFLIFGNDNSCLCGGKIPTVCCNPAPSDKDCYCPDGSLKNLCNPDCDTSIIDFWLPSYIVNQTLEPLPTLFNCWGFLYGETRDKINSKFKISYKVEYLNSGKIIKSEWIDGTKLESIPTNELMKYPEYYDEIIPNSDKANISKKDVQISIPIPKNEPCKITIIIRWSCGFCCYKDITKFAEKDSNDFTKRRPDSIRTFFVNISNMSKNEIDRIGRDSIQEFVNNYSLTTEEFNNLCEECK